MTKEIPMTIALELTRLQVQRDELADLVRLAVSHLAARMPSAERATDPLLDGLTNKLAEILDDQRKRKVG